MRLMCELGAQSYPIIIKRGALGRAGLLANLGCRVMLVTDDGVPKKYVNTLLRQCPQGHVFVMKAGEASKSPATWQALVQRLHAAGFGPGDVVAALGGGVACDVAGFAAASYMRGILYYQLPTTLLAQAGCSVGGKTGLNLDGVKDVVGAFHQPALVLADPDTLATLPPRHHANGLAEVLKTALVGSAELFEILENEDIAPGNTERILFLCLQYKKAVVQQCPAAQGESRLLGFGQLIGHAIESACGPGGLLYGESTALGMLPMIESRVLRRRARAVMRRLGLPLRVPCKKEDALNYLARDSRCTAGACTVARVKKPGQGYLESVPREELGLLLDELCFCGA